LLQDACREHLRIVEIRMHDPRDQPFFWWGPFGEPDDPPDLARLIANGTLSSGLAAFLAAAVHHRASLAVVAGPSGAGKSALLSALLAALPAETARLYPRGMYEDFRFLRSPDFDPQGTALLVNEISPHLPIYLWGESARRALALREQGIAIHATAHATTVAGFAAQLAAPPLDMVQMPFDLVVVMGEDRRVHEAGALLDAARGHADIVAIDLEGDANALAALLEAAHAARSPLAAIPSGFADTWLPWAMQEQARMPDPERPGAMLARRPGETGSAGSSP
jgi:energy-coupling factor transporter ATP-binding protein EcfA2